MCLAFGSVTLGLRLLAMGREAIAGKIFCSKRDSAETVSCTLRRVCVLGKAGTPSDAGLVLRRRVLRLESERGR